MSHNVPASVLDWVRAPSPEDKKAACGRVTQIVEYSNGTIGVMAFYCHRWDCERCETKRRKEIKLMITSISPYWFMKIIDDKRYTATQKQVNRAGAKYCAVGRGNNVLILTKSKVFEESTPVYGRNLEHIIDLFLNCSYAYRRRRFRHSRGLLSKSGNIVITHIKRKIAVNRSKEKVVAALEENGYAVTNREKDIAYMRPILLEEQHLISMLEKDKEIVEWIE